MAWISRLRALFRRNKFTRELDEELMFHLSMREQWNVEQGMPRAEAHRDARRRFVSNRTPDLLINAAVVVAGGSTKPATHGCFSAGVQLESGSYAARLWASLCVSSPRSF